MLNKLSLARACIVSIFTGVLLLGCAQTGNNLDDAGVSFDPETLSPAETEKLFVVDCLLPAQVRKMGQSLTFLAPRRPIKTSAMECEIRGGEYVAYDRADYATALKVWLPQAKEGNPEAQTYVGEIYEKGLGIEPDYMLAAEWYRKAAAQNYARGQINLGHLYEKGLGVDQDLALAMNWYRRASGLTGELEFVSAVDLAARRAKDSELEELRFQVTSLNREADGLRVQLGEAQQDAGLRLEIAQLESQAQKYRAKLVKLQETQLALAGPEIEIFDPLLTVMRGVPSVRLRSNVKEREIKGKVSAPAGVKFFSVNDQKTELSIDGSFQVYVPIVSPETPVKLVATDNNNRDAKIAFVITPAPVNASAEAPRAVLKKAGDIEFGRYYALIIGNNNYSHLPKLQTAVSDAQAVEQVLRTKYDFDTTLLLDVDRHGILSALYELRSRMTKNDNLLIYYAGHGDLDTVNDRGYWLPVNADSSNPANWISNVAITDVLNTLPAKHVLVIADSCYSGAMSRTAMPQADVSMPDELRRKWFKLMAKSRSRTVLTSGGLKPVLDEGGGEHSVFAGAFLDALERNDEIVEGYRLFRRVSGVVSERAAKFGVDQVPEYAPIKHAGHETGQFLFVPSV